MGKLNIIGVGPGSADYVTPAARKAVEQAQLVIGAQRSIALFDNDVKSEKIILTAKNLRAAKAVNDGKNVALLSTGDPGFSGLLHTALESGLFKTSDLAVIPGVSSIQVCAARLNLNWHSARLFTFHEGHVSDDQKQKLVSAYQCGRTIILLPDAKSFAPKDIAVLLIGAGADKNTPVYVCENLTLENEAITSTTLEQAQDVTFGPLSVMVIKQ
jgi:cobalt-precorrin-7 (C5)-methyltransferase